jgi:hypothetical protein
MPLSQLTREDIARLIVTPKQAARIADLHRSRLDSMKAEGRLHSIDDENGRLIAFFREDIVALIGGAYRKKPGRKAKLANKPVKEGAA